MRYFLLNIFLFSTIYIGSLYIVYMQPYQYDNFFHSVELKHNRLKAIEPQVILVGGSNTLFGVDSQMIVDSLGYDVVNMGLHMGLGYYIQTKEVIPDLRKDDIVLLIPEYNNYFDELPMNKRLVNQLSEHYPRILLLFDRENRFKLFYKHFLDKLKKNVGFILSGVDYKLPGGGGYSLSGINKYGDQTDHLKVDKGADKLGNWTMSRYKKRLELNDIFYKQTEAVIQKCKEKGCKVFISFPALARSAYSEDVANKICKSIDDKGYSRLGHPRDLVFDNKEFYDTHYHPLKNARAIRTNRVIAELKKKLQQ